MDFNEYQKKTRETAEYGGGYGLGIMALVYTVLGLNGEAGEVAEILKKEIRKGNVTLSIDAKARILDELGDVLWYLASICHELGVELNWVAGQNLDKLQERKRVGQIKDHN